MPCLIKKKSKKERKVYKNPNAKTVYQYNLDGTYVKQ